MTTRETLLWLAFLGSVAAISAAPDQTFAVDTSPVPITHAALAPAEGAVATTNPPSLIWRHDATADHYVVEFSPAADFSRDVIRTGPVAMPFYNHNTVLANGTWYWRYFVVRAGGAVSAPGPVRSFQITATSVALPVPSQAELLAALPAHPRIYVRPEQLAAFQARRLGAGREAWANIQAKADALLALSPARPQLQPLPARLPSHRQQVFLVERGTAWVPAGYGRAELRRDAERADLLSLAYLISGEKRYAEGARTWAMLVAPFRLDYHLPTVAERGQHDSVVYAYEKGVLAIAVTYDRLYALLTPDERQALLDHVEYHGEAAFHWIRNVLQIHLAYQDSHGQQCMHALLPTALAIAGESDRANDWLAYIVPQYANRIAWTSEDGGYFEGQSYAFKFSYILEALCALRTAAGIDLFQKPAIRNTGDFWLYCMSLNYWWPHWGDNMPLVNPYGNAGDAYISALLASATGNRPLQWWSETTPADPSTIPFSYLAATGVRPQPPVAVAQARVFPDTGVVAAYDRFYDHGSPRIFFRSSQWGGHSHAQADQNSFVLHAGGEILAADVGYYTYYGDENYQNITSQTIAHNSVLIDGKGQSNDIEGKGAITEFFSSPQYTFFSGDASGAYGPALNRFRRDVVYLRPDVFVIADELRADQAGKWSWLLNTFAAPEIDAAKQEFTVTQRHERLWGRHVFPESLHYSSGNVRKFPLLSRRWTRYGEAFPEPWRMQAVTDKTGETNYLTVMHAYDDRDGRRVQVTDSLRTDSTLGVRISGQGITDDLLLRRTQESMTPLSGWGAQSDGRVFSVRRDETGKITAWMAITAQGVTTDGATLLTARAPVSLAVVHGTAAAAAQIAVAAAQPTEVAVALPGRPQRIRMFPPNRFTTGRDVDFRWNDGVVHFAVPEGESVFWADPVVAPSALPEKLMLTLRGATGDQLVPLETAIAENGDWIGYAAVEPRAPGVYEMTGAVPGAEFLLQDRWDPERTARGRDRMSGLICAGTQVVVRFPPTLNAPDFSGRLTQARSAATINLLRNGDCEAGLPHYPPRGWTVRHGVMGEPATAGTKGFPEWSTEDAASGRACLKFTRPLNVIGEWRAPFNEVARDTLTACAPPVRLIHGGAHVLAWKARGTATHVRLLLSDGHGKIYTRDLEPSPQWRDYRIEADLPAGYTEVKIQYRAGGADDQVVWVDDVFLAPAEARAGN